MSVLHADRGHLTPADSEAVEAVLAAIRDLPAESQDEVHRELARVVVDYQRTHRVDPVLHFVQSLFMTARLYARPEFRKALAEADAEPVGEGRDVAELLAELRERRRR